MPNRKLSSLLCQMAMAAMCLLTTSCFETHEELWVNADGSARAEFRYNVPKRALLLAGGASGLDRQVREMVANLPELRLDSLTLTPTDDRMEMVAQLSTDSLLWLRDIKKNTALKQIPETTTDFAGVFKIKLEDLKVDFCRTINIGHALGFTALAIGDEDREKRHLYCAIHLPLPAIESNATRTEDGGRTLVWDNTLGDALNAPLVTRFRAPIPLPRWLIPAVTGAAIVAGLILWLAVRWCLRRRRQGVRR